MHENFHTKFLTKLISLYSKKSEAVEGIGEILSMSSDGVYRRLRGETLISLDEMSLLAEAHKLSIDKLLNLNENDVMFTFNSFDNQVRHVDDFVNNLLGLLRQFSMVPDAKVLYASAEIPVFYHAYVPELFSFKLYVWARTVWNLDYFHNEKFKTDIIPFATRQSFKLLTEQYKHLNSVELWSYNIFDNTLNQIEYHLESALFENEHDAIILCEALETICNHMRQMAIHGRKFSLNGDTELGSELTLFHNEIVYTNNTILYTAADFKILFTTFCNPNFIMTKDQRICDFSHDWFNTVVSKSQLISGLNERQRNKYFDGIQRRIALTKKRIELFLGII